MSNGSDFVQNPWNITFSPFTDLFERFVGNGNIFFIFPLIILTFGIYFKTKDATLTSVFMIGSGALLSVGTFSQGLPDVPILFGIFAALGFVPLFYDILFGGK